LKTNIFETFEFDKILAHLSSFTVSPLGNELVDEIKPWQNLQLIQKKLSEVTELREILDFDDPFPIYGFLDIRIPLKKATLVGNYLSPEELIKVNATLAVFRRLYFYFKDREGKYPLIAEIVSSLLSFPQIEKEINRCINSEKNEIYDNASPELARIRKSMESILHRIRKKMEEMVSSLSQKKYLQESIITIRDGRLVLLVKDEYRRQVKGIVHDQSATGATLFIEPMETLELNNQIRALKLDEKREIEKILLNLTELIRHESQEIQQSLAIAAQLDFLHTKARFSSEINGFQPFLNDKHTVDLIQARHPLLLLRKGKKEQVIPLDMKIEKSFNTLIITGPNAGGKTVALKTIGLLSLMVQCGLHIPADPSSDLCVFQNIFGVIGDQQSIENDLSTFSSHVEKLKFITDTVNKNDLVIIDEIGAGTDPEEGAALAIAVLERLTSVGCITIVSTHQGALKAFAHETDCVENGSMEFNAETLQPTYRFRLGLPGSSYAFEIAQRWGLSGEIINRSRQLVGKEKHHLENLLVDLEKRAVKYQSQLNEINIKQSELDGLIKLYMEKRNQLISNEKSLKQKAVSEADEIIRSANATVEQAIREIRQEQATRTAIRQAKQQIEQEREKIRSQQKILAEQQIPAQGKPLSEITIGQRVRWKGYNQTGTILSNPDASDRLLIDTGEVKVKVPLNELEALDDETKSKSKVRVSYRMEIDASNELDLRGMRAEEAQHLTEKFIEDAVLAGLHQLYIIHGKGTGALRKTINSFLDKHNQVVSKHLADWNQGGSGVTVVNLK